MPIWDFENYGINDLLEIRKAARKLATFELGLDNEALKAVDEALKKQLTATKRVVCPTCNGTGRTKPKKPCDNCEGTGFVDPMRLVQCFHSLAYCKRARCAIWDKDAQRCSLLSIAINTKRIGRSNAI